MWTIDEIIDYENILLNANKYKLDIEDNRLSTNNRQYYENEYEFHNQIIKLLDELKSYRNLKETIDKRLSEVESYKDEYFWDGFNEACEIIDKCFEEVNN